MAQTSKKQTPPGPSLRQRAQLLRARVPEGPTDPVLAVIREGRRLFPAYERASLLPDAPDGRGSYARPQAENDATDALIDHLRGPLLQTVPETPAGAVALAKHVTELGRLIHYDLQDEARVVLDIIARAPLA